MTNSEINEAVKPGKSYWYNSIRGREYRRNYRKIYASRHAQRRREQRQRYIEKYPEKVQCRLYFGMAVRQGFIPMPEQSRNWHNKWDFHHPDHSRPFYGVWLTRVDHRRVHLGRVECPPCVDYAGDVEEKLLRKWGLRK